MKMSISNFILEKFGLSAELTMNILTTLSVTTGITVSYEWVIRQNYFWVSFWAIASVATICLSIWFNFKNKFPRYNSPRVKKIKIMIFFAAFLLAAAQAGSMQVFLAEGFSAIPWMQMPSYFGSYKITGILFFEVLVPLYSLFIFGKTNKQIEKYNKEGIPIFQNLGWSHP